MHWEEAINYCESLTLAGYDDWRLPSRNELQSIVDYSTYDPAIDTIAFPDTMSSSYWSSTFHVVMAAEWLVDFNEGLVHYDGWPNSYYVRAVRGGQAGLFGDLVISVTDAGTGLPVTGAEVVLMDQNLIVDQIAGVTGPSGEASLTVIPFGGYDLTVTAAAYLPLETQVTVFYAGSMRLEYTLTNDLSSPLIFEAPFGIERARINGITGNFGIGTTNPTERLEVAGTVKATSFIGDGSGLTGITATESDPVFSAWDKSSGIKITESQITDLAHFTNSDETDPVFGASVAHGITSTDKSHWNAAYNWGDHALAGYDTTNDSWIGQGDVYTTSGNCGIGTTSPLERLHINGAVRGNIKTGALRVRSADGYLDIGPQNRYWTHLITDRPRFYFNREIRVDSGMIGSYDEDLSLQTEGITRMTINKDTGNCGIGTTSPQQKMHISGVMRLEPQSSPPSGALGDLYVGTNGKLYFHNGTQWKEVSLL